MLVHDLSGLILFRPIRVVPQMLLASVPFGTGAFLFSRIKLPSVPTEPAVFVWEEKFL